MRFLADESCDFRVVYALRRAGFDVVAAAEIARGSADEQILDLALNQQRICLTEDKDFGQLIFAGAKSSSGVIFIRFPEKFRSLLPEKIVRLVKLQGDRLLGSFIVVQPKRIRISHLP